MASEIGSQLAGEAQAKFRELVHEAVNGKKHSLDQLSAVSLAGLSLEDFDRKIADVADARKKADAIAKRNFDLEAEERRAAVREIQHELSEVRSQVGELNRKATELHNREQDASRQLQQVRIAREQATREAREIKAVLDEFGLSEPSVDALVVAYSEERARRTGVPAAQA